MRSGSMKKARITLCDDSSFDVKSLQRKHRRSVGGQDQAEGMQIHYANKVNGLIRIDWEKKHVFKQKIKRSLCDVSRVRISMYL